MTGFLRTLLRRLLGNYELYRIFGIDLTRLDKEPQPQVRVHRVPSADTLRYTGSIPWDHMAQYAGDGSYGFLLLEEKSIAAVCFVWHGDRYRTRNFWPLQAGEGKLVQIVTLESFRGRGIATSLLEGVAWEMRQLGFRTLYARIWHNNTPSIRTFQKAGWREIAFVIRLFPLGLGKPWRFVHYWRRGFRPTGGV